MIAFRVIFNHYELVSHVCEWNWPKLFNFGILSDNFEIIFRIPDGTFFHSYNRSRNWSWKSYLNSICTFFHFFTFTRARIKLSLLEARFSHVFRGRFIVHCRVNRRPRSCLGPKSLAISTPTRTWTTFGSTSCQISLISKVFPLPISLVSSHYSQPPLTLGEFVHGGRFICQVLFPQRNCSIFKEKEYETERKFLLTIDT